MNRLLLLYLLLLSVYACKQKTAVSIEENADNTVANDTLVTKTLSLTKLWETDTVLHTPESVLYDKAQKILYISNIGGVPPVKKDGDGFISKVSTDGKIITLKWATGFDAPKGLGLAGTTLYVTDIDRIKAIDTKTGKTIETWRVPGSTFLNDVAITHDSTVYFTDSDTKTIHKLRKGRLSQLNINNSIAGLNGIYFHKDTLYLAGYSSGHVYAVDPDGQSINTIATGIPNGDGIERYKDGWIVSNWNGEIHHINNSGEVVKLLDTQYEKQNAADIEVIEERDLLIVPTFFGNKVVAYQLKMKM